MADNDHLTGLGCLDGRNEATGHLAPATERRSLPTGMLAAAGAALGGSVLNRKLSMRRARSESAAAPSLPNTSTFEQAQQELASHDAKIRKGALARLMQLDPDRALPLVAPLLVDPDVAVRLAAATLLVARAGDGRALAVLIGLAESGDCLVRISAVFALRVTRDNVEVARALCAIALNSKEPGPLRSAAITSLSLVGTQLALPALKKMLLDQREDLMLRAVAGGGLQHVPGGHELLRSLLSAPDPTVRVMAAAYIMISEPQALPTVIAVLRDSGAPLVARALALDLLEWHLRSSGIIGGAEVDEIGVIASERGDPLHDRAKEIYRRHLREEEEVDRQRRNRPPFAR